MVSAPASEKVLIEALIRFSLIFTLMAFCYHFIHPFLNLMLWSLVLAVGYELFWVWVRGEASEVVLPGEGVAPGEEGAAPSSMCQRR